jgi:hypothetical protein
MGKTMFAMHLPLPMGSMLHVAENGYFSASTSMLGMRPDWSSLEDILQRINRSNSWAYLKGIVPLYDLDGSEILSTKVPPQPWEILPEAVIKVGKKAWATEDIDAWIDRMKMRASRVRNAHTANGMPLKENNNV